VDFYAYQSNEARRYGRGQERTRGTNCPTEEQLRGDYITSTPKRKAGGVLITQRAFAYNVAEYRWVLVGNLRGRAVECVGAKDNA
jgi:hypothetical protein